MVDNAAAWVPGIGQVIVGFAVACIAWRQHKTAKEKLRLDLFEKRFAVWSALTELVNDTCRNGRPNLISIHRFTVDTADARFLFGDEVTILLGKVRTRALDLWAAHTEFEEPDIRNSDKRFHEVVKRKTDLLMWFAKQPDDECLKTFDNYLRFNK